MSEEVESDSLDLMTDKLIDEMDLLGNQAINQQKSDLDNVKKTIPHLLEMFNNVNKTKSDFEKRLKHLENTILSGQQIMTNEMVTLKKTIPEQQKLIEEQRSELDALKKTIDSQMADIKHLKESKGFKSNPVPSDIVNDVEQLKAANSVQQKLNDSIDEKINNLESNPVPIGFIYVQLFAQSEPQTLWPNTEWENISAKYSGLFFRAEGGQASDFGEVQEQQTRSIATQSVEIGKVFGEDYVQSRWQITEQFHLPIFTGCSGSGTWYGIQFKHYNEEVRPRNQAVRIWQRIK